MATAAARAEVTPEEYLSSSYEVDRDLVDGELQERNLGEFEHSEMTMAIVLWFGQHRDEWGVMPLPGIRTKSFHRRYRVADLLIRAVDAPYERVIATPPLIAIEILSPEERISRYHERIADYRTMGIQNIWIIDPVKLEGFDCSDGNWTATEVFRVSGSEIFLPIKGLGLSRKLGLSTRRKEKRLESATERKAASVADPYLIEQDWAAYTTYQHEVWAELVRRRMLELREHACQEYLDGFEVIGLHEDSIPHLSQVNRRLEARTGWNATPVSGFLPPDAFFEMLAARRFPTTTSLRGRGSLEYTPAPDIFHDVFGHVPMHAHPVFADFLQQYGKVCARLRDKDALERMGRLFWFTVEFGIIRQNGKIKLYGSELISSHGESNSVIHRKIVGGPEIRDFNLDQVLDQKFLVSEMQKVLYAVESFEQIYEAAHEAERRL